MFYQYKRKKSIFQKNNILRYDKQCEWRERFKRSTNKVWLGFKKTDPYAIHIIIKTIRDKPTYVVY